MSESEIEKFTFDQDPAELTDEELLLAHFVMHNAWAVKQEKGEVSVSGEPRSNEDLINYHALILAEMERREMSHMPDGELDEQSAALAKDLADAWGMDDDLEHPLFEKSLAPWGSPAGKSRVARRLVQMIPDHDRYIEPFAGSAAVFFYKDPVKDEILCEGNPEIAAAFKFLKAMTGQELRRLKRFDWTGSRRRFALVKEMRPRDRVERFYKFKYLAYFSFASARGHFEPHSQGVQFSNWNKLERAKDRLKWCEVIHGDGVEIMTKRTTKNTFTFLGPPYWATENKHVDGTFDVQQFKDALRGIRGRWLMTLMAGEAKTVSSRFRKRIYWRHAAGKGAGFRGDSRTRRAEYLLANYDVAAKKARVQKAVCEFLAVSPSGTKRGREITRDEVLARLNKGFKVRTPYIYLVGGLAIHGKTEGDIDLLVKDADEDSALRKNLEFRIQRALSPELAARVQFHYDHFHGPFTNHVPLYDLQLERINTDNRVIEMSADSQDDFAKQAGPFLEYPDEAKKYGYVLQHHWRGKTTHTDLRMETGKGYLIGWTMADLIADKVPEAADTRAAKELGLSGEPTQTEQRRWENLMFEIASGYDAKPDWFKIDWKTGRFQQRETEAGNVVPAQLRSFQKARQPVQWLNVEGVTKPFPAPGATKEFRGVFTVLDGTPKTSAARVEYGRQDPQFHEYFLSGGLMRGRLVFRQLEREALKAIEDDDVEFVDGQPGTGCTQCGQPDVETRMGVCLDCATEGEKALILPPSEGPDEAEEEPEGKLWVAIQPLDQRPQFLTKRAVDNGDMPPVGASGLPQVVREAIPTAHHYWKEKTAAAARKMRDDLVAKIDAKEVVLDWDKLLGVPAKKNETETRFVMLRETDASSQQRWHILMSRGKHMDHWTLDSNPLDAGGSSATLDTTKDRGILDTEKLDEGPVVVLEEQSVMMKFEFAGSQLKGQWTAQRSTPGDAVWRFESSKAAASA